jgi:hypothetical protein
VASRNFSIGIISEDIALFHALYRTSIKGRRDLIKLLFCDDNDPNVIHKIDKSYTNRVAEIFNVTLKTLGLSLEFVNDEDRVKVLSDDNIEDHVIGGKHFIVSDYQAYLIQLMYDIRENILEERPIITKSELDKIILDTVENKGIVDGPVKRDLLKLLTDTDSKIEESREKFIEELNDVSTSSNELKEEVKSKTTKKVLKKATKTKEVKKKAIKA